MTIEELARRFRHHPPNEERRIRHERVREDVTGLALSLNEVLPDGREKSLAFTALEEVLMWSNAAIARDQA